MAPVDVGIYVTSLSGVDLQADHVDVVMYVWFRYDNTVSGGAPGASRTPPDTDLDPLSTLEIPGGSVVSIDDAAHDEVGGRRYESARIHATVPAVWDVRAFPLDRQVLHITLEDSTLSADELAWVPDVAASGIDSRVSVAGFQVASLGLVTGTHTYATNYGNTARAPTDGPTFATVSLDVALSRPGRGLYFKLLWGSFLSGALGLVALFIKPTDVDPRFGVSVGALFTVMANEWVIAGSVPSTDQVTLGDRANLLAASVIASVVVGSVVSLSLCYRGHEDAAGRLDKALFVVLAVAFVAGNAWLAV